MTIKYLKELIKDLPDDMRIYADDGTEGILSDNSEFTSLIWFSNDDRMCILQTKNDYDVEEELNELLNYASENDVDEQDFWTDFIDIGYIPEDFETEEQVFHAREQLINYGLI